MHVNDAIYYKYMYSNSWCTYVSLNLTDFTILQATIKTPNTI